MSHAPMDFTQADDHFRERFWSKVNIAASDECWEWTAGRKPAGYGQFYIRKGVPRTASRVAFALGSPVPRGMEVCHRCDNPPCCNPSHLFLGTRGDNLRDSIAKGRANRSHGEAHRDARLTAADVRAIRASNLPISELARMHGIGYAAMQKVVNGQTWRHVA